jgi:3-phosphoshikimate 1-carboxyvinyltransferase
MKVTVFPSVLSGVVYVPTSKSIAQRIVACASMAVGETRISHFPSSDDCQHALEIARSLGAVVRLDNEQWVIKGGFPHNFQSDIRMPKGVLFCGESGLAARMFSPIAALWHEEMVIEGAGTLNKRSMKTLEEWLPQLDVRVKLKEQGLPVRIQGPLEGGKVLADDVHSSQFVTGLMLAGAASKKGVELEIAKVPSIGYVDTTIAVAKRFNVEIEKTNTGFWAKGGQKYQARQITVDGDWSGAAFLLVAAALCAEDGLLIQGLSTEIPQADQAILEVLKLARVRVEEEPTGYRVFASKIKGFQFDATDCPDLIPILAVLAVYGDAPSVIKGAKRLADKESNRAKAIQHEWSKMGINTVLRGDELKVYPKAIQSVHVHGHDDHRMVMALAVMALGGASLTIHSAQAVTKSYPEFFEVIKSLGARIE